MFDFDSINIELSRMDREAYDAVRERVCSSQLGEDFREINYHGNLPFRSPRYVLDRTHELNGDAHV